MLKYYDKDCAKLFLGDCVDILNRANENSVDMIFADPPYFLSNGGITCKSGKIASVDKGDWDISGGIVKDFEFHKKWIKACHRVLKPTGTIWVSGTYHSIYACGYALQSLGFKILNDICWFKPNASPNMSCRYFTASHETLIWAKKDGRGKHIFNYELIKNGDWSEDLLKIKNKQMRSVWAIGTPKAEEKIFGKHPTQKPLNLLRRIILSCTKKGDLVLDPFTGSSTTGVAALETGRNFIGIDLKKEFLDLSIKRIEKVLV